ncbi:Protein Y8A9A.2, partial [Aphelenchoides avenae]
STTAGTTESTTSGTTVSTTTGTTESTTSGTTDSTTSGTTVGTSTGTTESTTTGTTGTSESTTSGTTGTSESTTSGTTTATETTTPYTGPTESTTPFTGTTTTPFVTTTQPVSTTTMGSGTCCPDNGVWSSWMEVHPCTDTCGSCGFVTKRRECLSEPECPCKGNDTKVENCNVLPCSYPRLSCCSPYKATVASGKIICGPQPGNTTEPPPTETCCPTGGVWAQWGEWSTCSGAACGQCGTATRTRTCTSMNIDCPCTGDDLQSRTCNMTGAWSAWSAIGACSDSCGGCGTSTRTRTCTSTGSCPCEGPNTKVEMCAFSPCNYPRDSCCNNLKATAVSGKIVCGPLPTSQPEQTLESCNGTCCKAGGEWSAWSAPSACTDTCGACGTTTRTRTCTSLASGCPCTGDDTRVENCNQAPCQYPRLSCCSPYKPKAQSGKIMCGPLPTPFDPTPSDQCVDCCPAGGVWSEWGAPMACTDTCGSCGTQTVRRTCLSTANGCPCTGQATRVVPCNSKPCSYPRDSCCSPYSPTSSGGQIVCGPIDATTVAPSPSANCSTCCPLYGTWSEWSTTASCTDVCGSCGKETKKRTCLSEASGCPCVGPTQVTENCGLEPCPYPRDFCCTGFKPSAVGGRILCGPQPNATENPYVNTCDTECCPDGGIWSEWSMGTNCSDTCGSCGTTTRTRKCLSTNFGCSCIGPSSEKIPCNSKPCSYPRDSCCGSYKVSSSGGQLVCGPLPSTTTAPSPPSSCCPPGGNGTWNEWGAWGVCSKECGGCGSRSRSRTCASASIGCPCAGPTTQQEVCNLSPCNATQNAVPCCVPYVVGKGAAGFDICTPGATVNMSSRRYVVRLDRRYLQ